MKFSKKDLMYSVVTGVYTGFIVWRVFEFLNVDIFDKLRVNIIFNLLGRPNTQVSSVWMIVLVPVLWILGVNLGYFLGRWFNFFNQFGRFAAIGFTNFVVYTGILNVFIAYSDISSGRWYSVFVGVAFVISAIHSYYWNKNWVFSATSGSAAGGDGGVNTNTGSEFTKFIVVSVIAGLVNIAVASFVVNFIHPLLGITPEGWANIGGIAGSAIALMFSFVGFRLIVFKQKPRLSVVS